MATITATTVQQTQPPITVVITDPRTARRVERRYNKWRNHRQASALTAATCIFIAGGMDLAMGLGWSMSINVLPTLQFQFSWFIGVIGGALLSSLLTQIVPKLGFYAFGGLLTLTTGIIFTSAPYNYEAILAARYISGIGIGLITVPFIVHSGEIAARTYRGTCTAFEQYGLTLGIFIQIIYSSEWGYDDGSFPANRLHGIFVLIFSVLGLVSLAFVVESPVFHLQRNDEARARQLHSSLVREYTPTDVTLLAFDDLKCYTAEGTNCSVGAAIGESLMPFMKLLVYRSLVAFSFSLPLTLGLLVGTVGGNDYYYWPAVAYACLRLVGSLVAIVGLDYSGRKISSLIGLICMAATMLGLAGIFSDVLHVSSEYYMNVVVGLIIAFSFFAGYFTPSSTTFLAEAFPLRAKPYLSALCICFEQLVHIITLVTLAYNWYDLYTYYVAVGVILLVGAVFFGIVLPETRGLTLREALHRFRRPHDITAY